jgi:hypothetical protein
MLTTGHSSGPPALATLCTDLLFLSRYCCQLQPAYAPPQFQALRSSDGPPHQTTFLLARASGRPLCNRIFSIDNQFTVHYFLTITPSAWLQTSSSLCESRLPGAEPDDAAAGGAGAGGAAAGGAGEHALCFGCHQVAAHNDRRHVQPCLLITVIGHIAAACTSVQVRCRLHWVRYRCAAGGKPSNRRGAWQYWFI